MDKETRKYCVIILSNYDNKVQMEWTQNFTILICVRLNVNSKKIT